MYIRFNNKLLQYAATLKYFTAEKILLDRKRHALILYCQRDKFQLQRQIILEREQICLKGYKLYFKWIFRMVSKPGTVMVGIFIVDFLNVFISIVHIVK